MIEKMKTYRMKILSDKNYYLKTLVEKGKFKMHLTYLCVFVMQTNFPKIFLDV